MRNTAPPLNTSCPALQCLWECGGMLAAPAISGGALHKALAFIAPKMVGHSVYLRRDVVWGFKQQTSGCLPGTFPAGSGAVDTGLLLFDIWLGASLVLRMTCCRWAACERPPQAGSWATSR